MKELADIFADNCASKGLDILVKVLVGRIFGVFFCRYRYLPFRSGFYVFSSLWATIVPTDGG
jgi:hypothetical protein